MAVVLLTGASGFLGIHVLQRLLDDGHHVRALVRSASKLRTSLALLGLDPDDRRIDVVSGDMTDGDVVRAAADGCSHAIHAAATYSYRRRDAQRMLDENVSGTTTVLDAAVEAGCSGIVHVSSIVALLRPGATLDHHSPLGVSLGPYTGSKVESERAARARQEDGAPITIVNPGAIVGPYDPYLGESNELIRDILRGRLPTWPRGGLQWVDVRDSAAVVVAALERPGRRYLVPGEHVTLPHETLREITGRKLPAVQVPLTAALPLLSLGYRTGWGFLPHALEGARVAARNTHVDSSATTEELAIPGRPFTEAAHDTVRWLVAAGHITARNAGQAGQA